MLFIHLGLAKTGTTALQSALRRASAEEKGIHYLGDAGLLELGYGFRPPKSRGKRRRLKSLIKDESTAVVSSENLIGSLYDVYSKAAERAESMRLFLEPLGPFKVILYLRPQTRWLVSMYVQRVKERSEVGADEFASQILQQPNFAFTSFVSGLDRALGPGRLIVRPYYSGIDVVADFFELVGIAGASRGEVSKENVSLSTSQVAVLRCLNEATPPEDRRMLRWREVFQDSANSEGARYSFFSKDTQQYLREFTERDWTNLIDFIKTHDTNEAPRFRAVLDNLGKDPLKEQLPMDLSTSLAKDETLRAFVQTRYRQLGRN